MSHKLDKLARALRQAQDARDAQDAAQLTKRAAVTFGTPPPSLVKRAIAWDEADGRSHLRSISQYGVLGLPPGERAIITKIGQVWKTFHFHGEHLVSDWEGEYPDADAALKALNEPARVSRMQGKATRAGG